MARMYSKGHGKSQSIKPYCNIPTSHSDLTQNELTDIIVDLGRKGKATPEIGNILRDEFAIGRQKNITNLKLSQILKNAGVASKIPEDVVAIEKKCLSIYSHIKKFWNDKTARYRLKHAESLLHRIIRYYKTKGVLEKSYKPSSFKLDKKFKI